MKKDVKIIGVKCCVDRMKIGESGWVYSTMLDSYKGKAYLWYRDDTEMQIAYPESDDMDHPILVTRISDTEFTTDAELDFSIMEEQNEQPKGFLLTSTYKRASDRCLGDTVFVNNPSQIQYTGRSQFGELVYYSNGEPVCKSNGELAHEILANINDTKTTQNNTTTMKFSQKAANASAEQLMEMRTTIDQAMMIAEYGASKGHPRPDYEAFMKAENLKMQVVVKSEAIRAKITEQEKLIDQLCLNQAEAKAINDSYDADFKLYGAKTAEGNRGDKLDVLGEDANKLKASITSIEEVIKQLEEEYNAFAKENDI